ncbi:VOC family protein [Sphaerisporangium sp. NPDC088356]|uniref:VOC family protein n=1 Tax=Sphaerisporangium sp. NPDC088356 TaxID=3154871 RepID=UPI0034274CCF
MAGTGSKIAVISVNVHDMDQAVAFYTDTLGFAVRSDRGAPYFVELVNDGPRLVLQLAERPAKADYPSGACIMINLGVADAQAELGRLRESGAELLHESLQESPVGPYFAVADPSGNVIELIQFSE